MKNVIPAINPEKETGKITQFISSTLKKTGFKKIVIGVSGGIDSATSLYLLRKTLPPENIFITHLHYFQPQTAILKSLYSNTKIPPKNQYFLSINPIVKSFLTINSQSSNFKNLPSTLNPLLSRVRIGNIIARVRMIILYDLAKKHNALVCGTENKSEHLLGYFTRFGDAASDLEPITHLYKTQVYKLAKYLRVPEEIINSKPTAGLWNGQTDEGEFDFTYQEADQVLFLYFDKKLNPEEITKRGFKNAEKVIDFTRKNSFKHKVPYTL